MLTLEQTETTAPPLTVPAVRAWLESLTPNTLAKDGEDILGSCVIHAYLLDWGAGKAETLIDCARTAAWGDLPISDEVDDLLEAWGEHRGDLTARAALAILNAQEGGAL